MTGGVGNGTEALGVATGELGAGGRDALGETSATGPLDGWLDAPGPLAPSVPPRPPATSQPAPRRPVPAATARTTARRRDAVGRRVERRGVVGRLGVTGRAMSVRRYRLMIRTLRIPGVPPGATWLRR